MEEDGMKRRRHEEDAADVSRQMFSLLLRGEDENLERRSPKRDENVDEAW